MTEIADTKPVSLLPPTSTTSSEPKQTSGEIESLKKTNIAGVKAINSNTIAQALAPVPLKTVKLPLNTEIQMTEKEVNELIEKTRQGIIKDGVTKSERDRLAEAMLITWLYSCPEAIRVNHELLRRISNNCFLEPNNAAAFDFMLNLEEIAMQHYQEAKAIMNRYGLQSIWSSSFINALAFDVGRPSVVYAINECRRLGLVDMGFYSINSVGYATDFLAREARCQAELLASDIRKYTANPPPPSLGLGGITRLLRRALPQVYRANQQHARWL